jgi:hypothetical protein
MLPTTMRGSAPIEVLATTSLTEVVDILSEKTSAISGNGATGAATFATCTYDSPSIASVGTSVPEQHPSMATTLKELNSHNTPSCTNTPSGHSSAPTVQAIVVNCVSIVEPQLASII